MVKKKKTGLGRGLDSLIPVIPEEDEPEEKSSLTLEDMLKEKEEEKKDKDKKKSKEKKNNEKSKSNKKSNKVASERTETQKPTKPIEKTEVKEVKTISEEIVTKKPSKPELLEDEIETKIQVESSQISKETEQPIVEAQKISDTELLETPTETSQPVDTKDEVTEVAKVTETEPETQQESEKTVEDIRNNLTEREKQSIDEVIKIIEKNPRITLWSAKSAAVFRYLRKTEPEFSISKEASKLIDEAVKGKYPEIWALFKDIEK